MHNRALHDSLAAFVEEAARQLADEVNGGAEVPFELIEQGSAHSPLYCYRPLTGRFIGERIGVLARLPSYPAAAQGLAALPDLPAYLKARGRRPPGPDRRSQADASLQAFLTAVWSEVTDFTFDPIRFNQAFGELEAYAYDGFTLSVVLAPVDGLVIESEELPLGEGLALVRAGTLEDPPGDLADDEMATVAVLALEGEAGDERALAGAGLRLRRLQTALRLWDDAEPALGPTAWARTDGSAWWAVPLATGFRRPAGDCLLAGEEEDSLRAFCSLVTRRTPRGGELAWALRRFELGCERASAFDALTDHLLALRALLEPEGPGSSRLAGRIAALCAVEEHRLEVTERMAHAVALERSVITGLAVADGDVGALLGELTGYLRALLRDVICGHLQPDLCGLADRLMSESGTPA
jgi:hypothetical protein